MSYGKLAILCLLVSSGLTTLQAMKAPAQHARGEVKKKASHNNCGKKAYAQNTTCCQACTHAQGPHTKKCALRTTQLVFEERLRAKSAKLNQDCPLYAIARALQMRIYEEFKTAQPPYGNELHVALVDSSSNEKDKADNFKKVQKKCIDITDLSRWDRAGNAFSLTIGNFKGHQGSIHLTIAYFPDGCAEKLPKLRALVQETLDTYDS